MYQLNQLGDRIKLFNDASNKSLNNATLPRETCLELDSTALA